MVSIKSNKTVILCSELDIRIDENECVYEDTIVDYSEIKTLKNKGLITIKTVNDDYAFPSAVMSKEDRDKGILLRKEEKQEKEEKEKRDKKSGMHTSRNVLNSYLNHLIK